MNTYSYIQYNQPGGSFYACTINAADVINRLEVRRRSDSSELGIQRDEDKKRIRDIESYLQKPEAIIPTPIIVSASSSAVSVTPNELRIDSNADIIGHILDGQHRVLGLRELQQIAPEKLELIELLIVFVFEIDIYSEATIFTTINSNQKQVSKSLIYDLFSLNPNRSIEKSCHEIVKSLNDDEQSPFYRKIKILGKKVEDSETLSQSAFIDQLIKSLTATNSETRKFYENKEEWALRKIISNVFSAINSALEKDENQYPTDYFYRTSGYGGVIQSLNSLIENARDSKDLSQGYFEKIMSDFIKAYPTPPRGTGNSAMLDIKRGILSILQQ
ncbi:DGQHR domain-containing protein [Pseudomonas sp. LA21]|uniref:DGQHR domain-containing protein n=1 Tax=unclassified Pseudomonas TaxID=196821 RepID=UPI001FB63CD4|nr:DGQHR domain-containing protein [Pseudomonas sp. LA21]MCJ1887331.1 DGQHR domain-containing protein [Pseudomonas sp. LA21]